MVTRCPNLAILLIGFWYELCDTVDMARNKQTLRPQVEHHYGSYLITYPDGSTELVQTDWQYPSTARDLGWSGKIGRERCNHRQTDGTIDCPDCGRTASEFIQAASKYLDSLT